ncbi:MAG: hypothetical protein K9M11_00040 [Candidatus Pacebacteria bacterium]|nr:hypothetical protein [Candidatus Paceibacterota bacterium]
MDEKIDNQPELNMNDEIVELNEKIDKLTSLAEENQRMIKNLYQRARMATVVVFLKWFIIIGLTLGSFYYIQPLVNTLVGVYGGTGFSGLGNSDKTSSADAPKTGSFNFGDLSNLLKSI